MVERYVLQLSGDERQRVASAQCAVQGAPLTLLDEPIALQDEGHHLQVGRWLATLVEHWIGFSAHDVNRVAGVVTHMLALHGHGRWEAGPARQMLDAARLEAIYGCRWRQEGGAWVAVD